MPLNKPGKRLDARKVIAKPNRKSYMQFKREAVVSRANNPIKKSLQGKLVANSTHGVNSHQMDGVGEASLFAKFLERNSITRTSQLIAIKQGDRLTRVFINQPRSYEGNSSEILLEASEPLYIYDKTNFNFARLVSRERITGTTTQFDVNSYSVRGKRDKFNVGSYIVPDFKHNLNLNNTRRWITGYNIPSGNNVYMNFLFTQNTWYSTAAYAITYGNGTLPATTDLKNSVRAFRLTYPAGGELDSAAITFQLYKTSSGSTSLNMEFLFCKISFDNDSTTIGTISKFLPVVSIDGTYTENKTYLRSIKFQPAASLGQIVLKEGEGLGVFMRCTNNSSIRVYGSGSLNVKQYI